MNPVSRGFRNAFRNGLRSASIVVILGLSIGLSFTMLVANKAVSNKISDIKSAVGTTVTISPAGFSPGSQANNALSNSQLQKVASLDHVTKLTETLEDRLSTTGSSQPTFGRGGSADSGATTSLTSPVKLNFNGNDKASGDSGPRLFVNGGGELPTNFSLPVSFLGTTDPTNINGTALTLTSGKNIQGTASADEVLVSQAMATKNNLKVGSKFTAYNKTLTVAGIFKNGTQQENGTVVLPLPAEQSLSGQSGDVTSAVATVDSLDNLTSTTNAIKSTLGNSADVISSEEQADDTVKPLNSVKTVSLFSLIGAVVAAGIIILLTMVIVVRERKREIGVAKAIGGSNPRIIGEFGVEALTLTIAGALIGFIIGVAAGQPVTNTLVDNSTSSNSIQGPGGRTIQFNGGAGGPARGFGGGFRNNGAVRGIKNINTEIGWGILLEGFGAAILIAVIGSALAAGMISKVRPSEILRSV